jgi:LPS export ABC transporter protein LptC/lipopolysaccharide transport protein LptA
MATTTNLEPERGWELLPAFGSSGTSDRTKNFARARRHTRTVRFLRLVLPVCAAGVVVIYVANVLQTIGWVTSLPKIEIPQIIPDKLTMDNPHYEGFNRDGGKYVVTAKTAVQELADTDHVKLNEINGDLVDVNKVKTNLKAAHGLYNTKSAELEMFDGIKIVSENGMRAKLSRATVFTKTNVIISKEPVEVSVPAGTIRSKEMTLLNKTHEATFLNDVVTHLVPEKKTPTPAAADAAAKPAASATPMLSAGNGPIDVTSNRLDIDDVKKTAIFTGHVRAVQADSTLETVGLQVEYESQQAQGANGAAPAPAPASTDLGSGSKIRRIESATPVVMTRAPNDKVNANSLDFDAPTEVAVLTGDVVMTSGTDRRVTGDVATIDQKSDTVLLTGSVVAVQGRNNLKGERLYVERGTGRTQLTSPAGPGKSEAGRITARFYRTDSQIAQAVKKQKDAATEAASAVTGVFKTDPTAPIDVEADRLDVDDKAKVAVFRGDVHAVQAGFTVRTSEMRSHYTGNAGLAQQLTPGEPHPAAQLSRIEARGKVIVTSQNGQDATGDWADFDVKENKVTLGGDVVLTQEKNVVRGTRLVIDMVTGESIIHNDPADAWSAKAAPENDASSKGFVVQGPVIGGRPSAIFYPRDKKAQEKNKEAPPTESPAAKGQDDDGWLASSKVEDSDLHRIRLAYWKSFSEYLNENRSTFRIRRPNKSHWFSFGVGRAGFGISATISTDYQRIGVELYAQNDVDKAAFHALHAEKDAIEKEFGEPLEWQELPGRKAMRIAFYKHNVDPSDANQYAELHAWMLAKMDRFRKVFTARIKTLPVSSTVAKDEGEPPEE